MDTVRAVEMRYVIQTAIVHTAEKNYKRNLIQVQQTKRNEQDYQGGKADGHG